MPSSKSDLAMTLLMGCWDYSAGIERQACRCRSNDDALRLLGLPWLHPAMERGWLRWLISVGMYRLAGDR